MSLICNLKKCILQAGKIYFALHCSEKSILEKIIGKDKNVEYFFGWVDRELAVVAPNVLSHSITVTDTLLRSVTYQHNGDDVDIDDGDGNDDDDGKDDDDDDDMLLKKFGNKICWQRRGAESNKIRL